MVPVLVDSDMAFDDWLALLYVALHPMIDLQAVTIVATGEAHGGRGADMAHRLLHLAGVSNCPIAIGRTTPFPGGHRFPLLIRLMMDARLGFRLPAGPARKKPGAAWQVLAERLAASSQPMTILALGPLTNLAELCLQRPNLIKSIERMVVMGGAIHVHGNLRDMLPKTKNTFAEWNMYIDPTAVEIVLNAGIPITLIPLDATNQAPITQNLLAEWSKSVHTPAADFALRVLRRMLFLSQRSPSGMYLWDVVAAVLINHPAFATLATHSLAMTTKPEWQSGHLKIVEAGTLVEVVETIHAEQFYAAFWQTLNGLG